MKADDLKLVVQDKYGQIAKQSRDQNLTSCCGSTSCCDSMDYTIFSDDYTQLEGYNPDADLGLGCGLPTEYAEISKGNIVVDLGSGAGNDCFVAGNIVGNTGEVVGIDFTDEMLNKAKQNLAKTQFNNISFVKGDIENIPLSNEFCDVVISNCVLNLVPNKSKAFEEIFRILKKCGHFSISDVVLSGNLPIKLQEAAEMYAGCVSGAIQKDEYLSIVEKSGFKNIQIKKEKQIIIPNEILLNYLNKEELELLIENKLGIYSITLNAYKL